MFLCQFNAVADESSRNKSLERLSTQIFIICYLKREKSAFPKEYLTPNCSLVPGTTFNFDTSPLNLRDQNVCPVQNVRSYNNHLAHLCDVLTRGSATSTWPFSCFCTKNLSVVVISCNPRRNTNDWKVLSGFWPSHRSQIVVAPWVTGYNHDG